MIGSCASLSSFPCEVKTKTTETHVSDWEVFAGYLWQCVNYTFQFWRRSREGQAEKRAKLHDKTTIHKIPFLGRCRHWCIWERCGHASPSPTVTGRKKTVLWLCWLHLSVLWPRVPDNGSSGGVVYSGFQFERTRFIMVAKAWWKEHEKNGHGVSGVRQRADTSGLVYKTMRPVLVTCFLQQGSIAFQAASLVMWSNVNFWEAFVISCHFLVQP